MKRIFLALGLAAVIFGGVYGLASSLNVNTQTLGAGNTAVAACQAGTLTVSYATAYDASIPGYEMSTVTVSGLDTTSTPNCGNKSYKIELTGASNAALLEITGTTPTNPATSFTTSSLTASNILAANVTGVHLTITG